MDSQAIWGQFFKSLKKKDWAGAIKSIDHLLEIEPDNPNHYLKKGDIYQKNSESAEAVTAYLKASSILSKQGFLKKAIAVYKMVLRIDPDNQEATDASAKILNDLEASKTVVIKPLSYQQPSEKKPDKEENIHVLDEQKRVPERSEVADFIEPTSYQEPAQESMSQTENLVEPTRYPEEIPSPTQEREMPVSSTFLAPFTTGEIDEILSHSEIKAFSEGDTIVYEGDTGDSAYLIKSGKVTVVAHILGREVTLASLSAGDLFGEVAYVTGRPRTANVIADGNVEVFEISRLLLDEIIERRPEIMSQINEIYSSRVQDTIEKVKPK